jgi:hypothetical protein
MSQRDLQEGMDFGEDDARRRLNAERARRGDPTYVFPEAEAAAEADALQAWASRVGRVRTRDHGRGYFTQAKRVFRGR